MTKQPLPYIPYFQTSRYRVDTMIELADIKPGEKAADLGSGDGRILIALAQAGATAHGYELDEKLNQLAQINITQTNICSNILIHQKDFWQEDLSDYSIITIYPMPDIMDQLEEKLFSELKTNSRILLNYYPFLHTKAKNIKDNIYQYIL